MNGWNGLDYVEVSDDQRSLQVFFLGKLPDELQQNRPGLEEFLRIEGGERVTNIAITDVDPIVNPDPDKDDILVVKLDKYGDFSTYTLRLVGVENIDPHYDHVDFSFKVDCPQDLDCALVSECEPKVLQEPDINYLAKDYGSFRQLILDRLALLVPEYTERHIPDIGVTLVELLAYTADYLSYHQDAVATEAYLDTARQRVSVRRHARLVDYLLHEGCNARAWVTLAVSADLTLDAADSFFITGLNDALTVRQAVLNPQDVEELAAQSYEVFEPLLADSTASIELRTAHNEIFFYTWGDQACCLERGSTSATLLDAWSSPASPPSDAVPADDDVPPLDDQPGTAVPSSRDDARLDEPPTDPEDRHCDDGVTAATDEEIPRALAGLKPGDVLIFEEVLGPVTGLPTDADPARRHAVRLTKVVCGHDPVGKSDGEPLTPIIEIEWAAEDALPFPLCISAIGAAPACRYLENISVARGNVILTDNGALLDRENLGEVPTDAIEAECECAGQPGDVRYVPGRYGWRLAKLPLTFAQPLPPEQPGAPTPAAVLLDQDVRAALPQVWLDSFPAQPWAPRQDLVASGPEDPHFVVEIDNHHVANLRFGDGELGIRPAAGMMFGATYRVGNGRRGNVGAEAISRLVLRSTSISGVSVTVRNPLPARGGTDAELLADAKLAAPHAFRQFIQRAVIAEDYAELAERNPLIQRAVAALAWTGSWFEAEVAVDSLGAE